MHTNTGQTYQERVRYYREKRERERNKRTYSKHKREHVNMDFDEALYQFKQRSSWQKVFDKHAKGHLSFYRDDERGIIGGVCAGIADKMNWDVSVVRLVVFFAGLILTLPTLVAYGIATLVLRNKGLAFYGRDEKSFWTSASNKHSASEESANQEQY